MFLAFLVHIISMVISFHINVIEKKIRKIGLWSKMDNPSFDKRVIHCKTQMLRPTDLYNSLFEQCNLIQQEQGPTKDSCMHQGFSRTSFNTDLGFSRSGDS